MTKRTKVREALKYPMSNNQIVGTASAFIEFLPFLLKEQFKPNAMIRITIEPLERKREPRKGERG